MKLPTCADIAFIVVLLAWVALFYVIITSMMPNQVAMSKAAAVGLEQLADRLQKP